MCCWLQFHIQHWGIGRVAEKCVLLYINVLGIPLSRHVVESATAFFRPHSLDNTHCVILSAFSWRLEPNETPKHTHFLLPYRFIPLISGPDIHIREQSAPLHQKSLQTAFLNAAGKKKTSLPSSLRIIHVHPVCLLRWSMQGKFPGWEWWQKKNSTFPMNNAGTAEWHQRVGVVFLFFFFCRQIHRWTHPGDGPVDMNIWILTHRMYDEED